MWATALPSWTCSHSRCSDPHTCCRTCWGRSAWKMADLLSRSVYWTASKTSRPTSRFLELNESSLNISAWLYNVYDASYSVTLQVEHPKRTDRHTDVLLETNFLDGGRIYQKNRVLSQTRFFFSITKLAFDMDVKEILVQGEHRSLSKGPSSHESLGSSYHCSIICLFVFSKNCSNPQYWRYNSWNLFLKLILQKVQ